MTVLAESAPSVPVVDPQEAPHAVRPRWVRPALLTLLALTAVLYLWGLGGAGWANDYYAAAVQAGTQSWKALLFGSLDAGNAITVDKPPASLWVMALSGRLFGFGTLSMLVPEALMGVASVALVYGAVRRVSGYGAGLLAGAVLALTPVAALMFRFNNPDALLVLLMVVAGYCLIRALDGKSTRWIALAGVAIGFAFLAKLLQALLVTPALALVVLVAIPGSVWHRLRDLGVGLVAVVVSAGWYLVLVSLWPSDSRPYIGGSTNNSLLQLALGYNGLGRVFGGDGNPGGSSDSGEGGGPGGGMFGGSTGITRMFDASMGTEISWLLPAALIGLVAGLWFTRRAPRTDRTRAALLLWGGWLLATAAVFSFMKGIMHPYYTIALAPAIAAVIGISVRELWRGKQFVLSRVVLAAMLVTTAVWNFILLDRTPEWLPWLRWVVLAGSIVVAAVLLAGGHRLGRWTVVLAAAGLLFGLGATAAYTVETVAGNHNGPIPTSGPARSDGGMGFGGPGGPGGPGGQRASDNAELKVMLAQTDNRWAAATVGSMSASPLELSTGTSIMSIGGFGGGDNSPTLEQFQSYVAAGQVHYFIAGEGPGGGHHGPGGDSGAGTLITKWVQQHFTATDVGGTEVYDLTATN
ncbi:glycosyltransferase family 39 protein [Mycolicibacterium sphagni]|uniref:Glycosyltransferase family 39 protein n=1 Tax=Mycolicibacterium sphagni TaxID=1786 RepID=A0ABX2JQG2_9MYCO|nr:glycosyltransferase family 39 protein [Mycolicibacterium sphagni]NTY59786.1 glycosyltransferase family 39 protein [Mycolicibacterium sphagni]